ncbi:MAG TPA: quinolinate synthase NadA [Candidatus Brocadiia bacterium]|nr:quinolinate synthase NadA [Candidatus Brocadiia bacterium]
MTQQLIDKINELRRKRNAVILAHNYQRDEIQDIADFTGDSLALSRQAAQTTADVVVFCGVHFMAETAALLCPGKTVLIPDPQAGCPMAAMVTVRELERMKASHPWAVVVCYVNSTAAVKAHSDICCTSANADRVVASLPADREIIFIPDKSLGDYTSRKLNRPMILWEGYCPTHHRILLRDIEEQRRANPGAIVAVHPECTRDVVDAADFVGSTSAIMKFCRESSKTEFIIGTEIGILHGLRKESPGKTFHQVSRLADCPNMKLISLEKVLWSLEDMEYVVTVPEDIAEPARMTVRRMLEIK